MNDEPPLIAGKDLKKNTDYWLTANFWDAKCLHNTKVRLKRLFPAKEYGQGIRGMAAMVVDDDGNEYLIYPNERIFAEEDTSS